MKNYVSEKIASSLPRPVVDVRVPVDLQLAVNIVFLLRVIGLRKYEVTLC